LKKDHCIWNPASHTWSFPWHVAIITCNDPWLSLISCRWKEHIPSLQTINILNLSPTALGLIWPRVFSSIKCKNLQKISNSRLLYWECSEIVVWGLRFRFCWR
jgi:hypothetical protein